MDSAYKKVLVKVCGALALHQVHYVVVGGIAVALNGYFRHSP